MISFYLIVVLLSNLIKCADIESNEEPILKVVSKTSSSSNEFCDGILRRNSEFEPPAFITPSSCLVLGKFSKNRTWEDILATMERSTSVCAKPSKSSISCLPYCVYSKEPSVQGKLIDAIKHDKVRETIDAIKSGASIFLKEGDLTTFNYINYSPIEYAIIKNKFKAFGVMFKMFEKFDKTLLKEFLGGLLILAVKEGSSVAVSFLIGEMQAPYIPESYLLQQAIMLRKEIPVIKDIQQRFIDNPEIRAPYEEEGNTLLHLCIKYNHSQAFIYLYVAEKDLRSVTNKNNLTPFQYIYTNINIPFLKMVNFRDRNFFELLIDKDLNTILHKAIIDENLSLVRNLVEDVKVSLEILNKNAQTPLLLALIHKRDDIAKYLILKGASFLAPNIRGYSVISILAQTEQLDLFEFALKYLASKLDRSNLYEDNIGTAKSENEFFEFFSDKDVFEYAVERLTLHKPKIKSSPVGFQILAQDLINNQLWKPLDILFEIFPDLMRKRIDFPSYEIYCLTVNVNIWDYPHILRCLIMNRIVDGGEHILRAILEDNEVLVEDILRAGYNETIALGNGAHPMEVAIQRGKAKIVQLFTEFTKFKITENFPLNVFVYLLAETKASFKPNSTFCIKFDSRRTVIMKFIEYFRGIDFEHIKSDEMAFICIKFELFVITHLNGLHLQTDELDLIREFYEVKNDIRNALYSQILFKFPVLLKLLSSQLPEYDEKHLKALLPRSYIEYPIGKEIRYSEILEFYNKVQAKEYLNLLNIKEENLTRIPDIKINSKLTKEQPNEHDQYKDDSDGDSDSDACVDAVVTVDGVDDSNNSKSNSHDDAEADAKTDNENLTLEHKEQIEETSYELSNLLDEETRQYQAFFDQKLDEKYSEFSQLMMDLANKADDIENDDYDVGYDYKTIDADADYNAAGFALDAEKREIKSVFDENKCNKGLIPVGFPDFVFYGSSLVDFKKKTTNNSNNNSNQN